MVRDVASHVREPVGNGPLLKESTAYYAREPRYCRTTASSSCTWPSASSKWRTQSTGCSTCCRTTTSSTSTWPTSSRHGGALECRVFHQQWDHHVQHLHLAHLQPSWGGLRVPGSPAIAGPPRPAVAPGLPPAPSGEPRAPGVPPAVGPPRPAPPPGPPPAGAPLLQDHRVQQLHLAFRQLQVVNPEHRLLHQQRDRCVQHLHLADFHLSWGVPGVPAGLPRPVPPPGPPPPVMGGLGAPGVPAIAGPPRPVPGLPPPPFAGPRAQGEKSVIQRDPGEVCSS
ncbi:hypothetical protein MTO96_030096 [Rhipicephalus appendiculatus]